jgi:hypothetical protein
MNIEHAYNLFLDDIREPVIVGNYMLPVDLRPLYRKQEWVIVRNYHEFTMHIRRMHVQHNILPDLISFDHDLADEHYKSDRLDEWSEKTGYDCAKWLCDYCHEHELPLPQYLIHSMNPAGSARIIKYLEHYKMRSQRYSDMVRGARVAVKTGWLTPEAACIVYRVEMKDLEN